MTETIQQISADLAQRLRAWLEQPDEATAGLQELQERLEALRSSLGARAVAEASRALSGSSRTIRAIRQRKAADTIAAACRELGIILEPKAPLKRAPRKKANKPAPTPTPAQPVGEGTPAIAPETQAPRERGGLLSKLRTAQ